MTAQTTERIKMGDGPLKPPRKTNTRPSDPIPFVMLGASGLFGDYVEIVESLGGRLRAVVQNVEDPTPAGQKNLAQRLAEYNAWLIRNHGADPVPLVGLEEFRPQPKDHVFLGFRGRQQQGLLSQLESRFGLVPTSLIASSALVSPTATIGAGVIIGAGCIVASQVAIGEHTLLNRGVQIGHDCEIGCFANIGPGVRMASGVRVETGAVIGIGATLIEQLTVGVDARIAAGAVVIRDVPPKSLVAGVPAIVKRRNEVA